MWVKKNSLLETCHTVPSMILTFSLYLRMFWIFIASSSTFIFLIRVVNSCPSTNVSLLEYVAQHKNQEPSA